MSVQQRSPTLHLHLHLTKLLQHYSSWYHLKKAVHMWATAIPKEPKLPRMTDKPNDKPNKLNKDHSALPVQELEDAELSISRFTHFQSCEQKLRTLKQASNNKFKHEEEPCSKKNKSKSKRPAPFTDLTRSSLWWSLCGHFGFSSVDCFLTCLPSSSSAGDGNLLSIGVTRGHRRAMFGSELDLLAFFRVLLTLLT